MSADKTKMTTSKARELNENPLEEDVGRRTAGQLEREVSQKIQALYRKMLCHQTGRVTCQLFDNKVALVLEDSLTRPVMLLVEENQQDLAKQLRNDLNAALQPAIKALVTDILGVSVTDVLSDTSLSTGRTAIVGILAGLPDVRNPEAIPKSKKRV